MECFLRKTSAIKKSQLVCWRQQKWRDRATKPGEAQMIPLRDPELSEFMLTLPGFFGSFLLCPPFLTLRMGMFDLFSCVL